MNGAGTPTVQLHKELHAGLVLVWGSGSQVPRKAFNRYIMEATGVGTRQSVLRYLEAWEDLGLIEEGSWQGREGSVKLLEPLLVLSEPHVPAPVEA